MKISILPRRGEQGHVLLLAIIITGLIGFILVTYLTLVQSQNASVMRSQAWNSAIPIIEAGVEEGLAHLTAHGSTNLACDGWTQVDNTYQMTRFIGENFYVVTITNFVQGSSNSAPIIDSKGYVIMPLVLTSAAGPLLAAVNAPAAGVTYLGRGVRVTAARDVLFVKGMVAKDAIDLNGNGVSTDSFDSSNPAYSTGGLYDPAKAKDSGDIAVNASIVNSINLGNADIHGHASTGPNGTISMGPSGGVGSYAWRAAGNDGIQPGWSASDMNVTFPDVSAPFNGGGFTPSGGSVTNAVSTYTTNSSSSASTIVYPANPPAPGAGYVTTNSASSTTYPSGSPGPVSSAITTNTTWVNVKADNNYPAAGTYIPPVTTYQVTSGPQSGRGTYYTYQLITGTTTTYTYPIFTIVSTAVTTNTATTVASYDYILDDGNYQLSSLSGTVYVRGHAVLYVTGSTSVGGLTIKPGAHLDLYSNGSSVGLAGNNTANSDGFAANFGFWGMPNVTSITLSGNAGFTGTIYAPNANFTMNGGGNNTTDFIGASITKSVTMHGHFNFHYDEALGRVAATRGWVVNSWNELEPKNIPKATVDAYGHLVFTSATGNN
ncbi:MAG: hypothetical protein QOF48_1225 [Verrucomicrobiota bacterium]|jgi:hypothetical protein